jgi:hypothetical protein
MSTPKPNETPTVPNLRDFFAAAALQGLMVGSKNIDLPERLAQRAYLVADAMLAEREKGQQ